MQEKVDRVVVAVFYLVNRKVTETLCCPSLLVLNLSFNLITPFFVPQSKPFERHLHLVIDV